VVRKQRDFAPALASELRIGTIYTPHTITSLGRLPFYCTSCLMTISLRIVTLLESGTFRARIRIGRSKRISTSCRRS
jgi:ribosomal protein S26